MHNQDRDRDRDRDREDSNDSTRQRLQSGDTGTGSRVMGNEIATFKLRLVRIGPDQATRNSPQVGAAGLSPLNKPRQRGHDVLPRHFRRRFLTDARDFRNHLPDRSFVFPQERNRAHEPAVSLYHSPANNRTFFEAASPVPWNRQPSRHPYQTTDEPPTHGLPSPPTLSSQRETFGNNRIPGQPLNRTKPRHGKSRYKHIATKSALPPIRRSHNVTSFQHYTAARISHGD